MPFAVFRDFCKHCSRTFAEGRVVSLRTAAVAPLALACQVEEGMVLQRPAAMLQHFLAVPKRRDDSGASRDRLTLDW